MTASERSTMPASWGGVASSVIEELGPELVAERLTEWWPSAEERVSLEGGGGQLLKHFIWMLPFMPRRRVEPLAIEIAEMRWYPYREPLGILRSTSDWLSSSKLRKAVAARANLEQRLSEATAKQ